QLDGLDPFVQWIAQKPRDEPDAVGQTRSQTLDAVLVEDHVRVDLHEEGRGDARCPGVQGAVEWSHALDENDVTYRQALSPDTVHGPRGSRSPIDSTTAVISRVPFMASSRFVRAWASHPITRAGGDADALVPVSGPRSSIKAAGDV